MKTEGLARAIVLLVAPLMMTSCVKNLEGSRMQVNISPGSSDSFSRDDLIVPTPGVPQGDPRWFSHYELHANILGMGTVRLKSFLIRPALMIHHPCLQYLPDIYCRAASGSTCNPYMNLERFSNIDDEILVATSVAETTDDGTGYRHVPGFDLMDRSRYPDELFVDPTLTDPLDKLARTNLNQDAVEAFCADLPEGQYLGNPNQLTKALNGENYGAVDGGDPRTNFFVGGITLHTKANLELMTELMLTRERDPERLSPENINENLPPGDDGQLILLAQKHGTWGSISFEQYRGVMTVYMESPVGLPLTWSSVIYVNLDEDPINF